MVDIITSNMEVYTDGSRVLGRDNCNYGGSGIWFGEKDIRNTYIPIRTKDVTNQVAELIGVKYALRFCISVPDLIVKTDSMYSINCATTWAVVWEKNNWKTGKNKDVLHSDIIKEIRQYLHQRESLNKNTKFIHVLAHSNILGNEEADKLARYAAALVEKEAIRNTIYFSSGILSQFWKCTFVVTKDDSSIEYNCAEQWHHHQKALIFGDAYTASQILQSQNPAEQKYLGRSVRNFDLDTWKSKGLDIVIEGNMHKFSQNDDLKKYLLDTRNKRLVEAREDEVWGIGISYSDAIIGKRWKGANMLGQALEIVRERLS